MYLCVVPNYFCIELMCEHFDERFVICALQGECFVTTSGFSNLI